MSLVLEALGQWRAHSCDDDRFSLKQNSPKQAIILDVTESHPLSSTLESWVVASWAVPANVRLPLMSLSALCATGLGKAHAAAFASSLVTW